MNLREITDAIAAGRKETVERAFCALVDYPNGGRIDATAPGLLVVAFNRVLADLAVDDATMPDATCAVLTLSQGSTFVHGVVAARSMRTEICRRIMDRFKQ